MRDFALLISEFNVEEEAGIEASWIGVDGMKRSVEYWEGESEESEGDEVLHILRRNKESRHTNSGSGKGSSAAANRRFSNRTFLPVVLLLAICLPFLFVRIAFLVLESATLCSSLGNFLLD
ncbi:hypothetical protein CK203_109985 [Vitis vinifera]|uniref:Transmembrane protein n=1 Tax=Vitis vinifera TaxID=29760 RepID=A0A438DWI2_VITVI|nr:hypothetical protein CK203_109985 [Vitis vinifera]